MMPVAPFALSAGMRSRTWRSSTTLSTAYQPESLSLFTVGACRAGMTFTIFASVFSGALHFKSTRRWASSAPMSSILSCSSFARFALFFHDALFAMKRVVEVRIVSTMRRLFARSDDPVSVRSTIASTSSGAFTSVAPQLNSTSALTPCFLR